MEIEVRLIECVDTNVTILSATGETATVGMEGQRIYRSEVTF